MLHKRECKRIEPLLWGYTAERLSETESARVQRHLNKCNECREQREAYGQAVQGIALLHAHPVPASLSNWQDLQRRLDAAPPVPARLSPLYSFRGAAAGIALAGIACLFVGIVVARNEQGAATQGPELIAQTGEQIGTKPIKIYDKLAKRLAANTPNSNPFGNKLKHSLKNNAKNNKSQEEDENASNPAVAQAETTASDKNLAALRRRSRSGQYWASARRRHHRHLHYSYQLARHNEQNTPSARSSQLVSLSLDASALVLNEGMEREQPEYVLTTIVDSAPQPRDFVMDTMTADTQNSNSISRNTYCNDNGKEIRGW